MTTVASFVGGSVGILLPMLFACLIPRFDGAILLAEWKEALWDRFVR